MKVLSLFDGIGGAAQALKELGIECDYYASEVDKYAIQIALKNHPEIKQVGDVNLVNFTQFKEIDLLIAGFPCQDLSCAKRGGKGLDGERSGLFSKCLEALEICKPRYFLFENVASMKKEWRDKISQLLGIEPIKIDSALLTAQQRKRLYWTNIVGVEQPEDKQITLKDIIEDGDTERLKSYCITSTYSRACPEDYFNHAQRQLIFKGCAMRGRNIVNGKRKDILGAKTEQRIEIRGDEKINCLTRVSKDSLILVKDLVRKLTPIECERLQGFPDEYTAGISTTQRYKALGNSFTVPVIKHILKHAK